MPIDSAVLARPAMLRRRQRLRTTRSKIECVIEEYIGHGGQGAVYRASADGSPVALKWYFPHWRAVDAGLRVRLEAILDAKRPSDRFLWPIDLVSGDAPAEFGYIMPLRNAGYDAMTALLAGRSSPSFRTVTTASYELAQSFHLLHAEGLSYQDISDRNVWFDASSGAIEICDVDNVNVNGVPSAVAGTPDYMAPEVMLGRAKPSADSDRYSLAVLIFQMLMIDHPLRGARELQYGLLDADAHREMYGLRPVFVLDPTNDSNRPVPGVHEQLLTYWPLYPSYIHELFTRAFTAGLHSPSDRVWESEWRKNLIRMRDAIVRCEGCGAENFYDERRGDAGDCWNCGVRLGEPLRIALGEDTVVLNDGTRLYEHHLLPQGRYGFVRPLACVTHHPVRCELCGLRNDSTVAWRTTTPAGATNTIEPRHVVRLEPGLKIDFGTRQGEVVLRTASAAR